MNFVKNPLGTFVAGILLVLVLGAYSASNVPAIGGTTNFDDLSVDSITVSGTATIGTVSGTSVSGTTVTGTTVAATTLTASGATAVQEFTQGGGIRATSTVNAAETLLITDLSGYSIIDYTPNVSAVTLTLPATSTMTTLLPTAGDMRTWVLRNATTSAVDITLAAGAGIDLQEPDGQNVVIGNTNFAWLTCYRKADTDVVCLVDESIPAD